MLTVQQYSVIEAGSGAEALSLIEANPDIQIVVSDYNMPDINGYELTRKIRRMVGPDKLRVIGVSSTTDIAVSAGFLKAGANDFISRPFMPEELQCRIANNADTLLQLKQLQELASRDYLTGLFNRRHFFENGPKLIKTVQARPSSTVAVLDIDHFKQLNDTHGHDIGDRVLELVARCLKDAVEGTGNLLARLGGEEFVILFPGMAPAAAMRFSDHLRLDISHATLQIGTETISVTASIGIAEADPADRFDHCLRSADQALYAAKQQGRNRVCLAAS
jgi:diguanylate cyclase (GGDEF)-like protein